MNIFKGKYYIEVKDKRYLIHPTANILLRLWDPAPSLRTQYQVQNETQIRTNQKVIKNKNDEVEVKNYPENKQQSKQLPKYKPADCPSCKRNKGLEFEKSYYCKNCEHFIDEHKHQIEEKILGQDHNFSTRLPYADERIREYGIELVITTCSSTRDMVNTL